MPVDELWHRFLTKDRLALSRLLTLISRGQELDSVQDRIAKLPPRPLQDGLPRTVAITGSGGVGKSSLIGKLIETIRARGWSVAVLACDPQSPLTGGALLGDRLRMPSLNDDGVFVRSVATPSGHQAVAEHLDLMVALCLAYGFDFVILETVGAGQGDTAVHALVDVVVLLVQPEAGDDVQWEKAGLLEVADLVVVHKADLPGADRTEAQVRSLLNLPGCRDIPILRASAAKGLGLVELYDAILTLPPQRHAIKRDLNSLIQLTQAELGHWMRSAQPALQTILEKWQRGELKDAQAAEAILVQRSHLHPSV